MVIVIKYLQMNDVCIKELLQNISAKKYKSQTRPDYSILKKSDIRVKRF